MVTAAAGLRYPVLTLCTHGTPLATSLVEVAMLWTLLVLVLLVWVIGFLFDVAGGLIHLLLLAALALLLFNLFSARRKAL
ncbi:MAG: lmo0937 family membrane protein [Vicinamibacterales bacterium]